MRGPGRPVWLDEEKLARLVRRARERWPDFNLLEVRQKLSKQVLIAEVQGRRFKLIVYRDGRVRCYGPLDSVSIALKRMTLSVLGLGSEGEGEGKERWPLRRASPGRRV